jgi:hypothetical protein
MVDLQVAGVAALGAPEIVFPKHVDPPPHPAFILKLLRVRWRGFLAVFIAVREKSKALGKLDAKTGVKRV